LEFKTSYLNYPNLNICSVSDVKTFLGCLNVIPICSKHNINLQFLKTSSYLAHFFDEIIFMISTIFCCIWVGLTYIKYGSGIKFGNIRFVPFQSKILCCWPVYNNNCVGATHLQLRVSIILIECHWLEPLQSKPENK